MIDIDTSLKVPKFNKDPLNLTRLLNAAALLLQLKKR